jgi:RNA polymerase sigma-70 factor (ECF subfamily)
MAASEDFARQAGPYRRELLAHCYRMLGSVQDAEDQVQETLLRAWQAYGDFQGRSSLRTWLYRIATNACLRAIENRARRPLPSGLGAPGDDPGLPLPAERGEVPWLEPVPSALLPADPAATVAERAGTRLALIAALQYLPGRARAVLILRDVLGWRAAEVAEVLGTTTGAVNSLLQRARRQLTQAAPEQDLLREPGSPADRDLLDRFAAAFERADVAGLVRLLTDGVVLEMPPQPAWFAGRDAVGAFLAARVLTAPGRFTMVPVSANGGPAWASYVLGPDGVRRAHGIHLLDLVPAGVARITAFNDPALFRWFGLPPALPAPPASAEPARPAAVAQAGTRGRT